MLCVLLSLQFQLKGQTAGLSDSPSADSGMVPAVAWHFPYESLEKAVAGDPEASTRLLPLKEGWNYSADSSDNSWSPVTGASTGGGAVFFRKMLNLSEEQLDDMLFISPPANVRTSLWVNGQEVGRTEAGGGKTEFELNRFLRAGQNTLTMRLDLKTATPLDGLIADALLYTRPGVHLEGVHLSPTLDKPRRKGSLRIDLNVESRMDSVRQRVFGLLREPLYTNVGIKARLVDDKGNTSIEFREISNESIRGGSEASFSLEGSLNNVRLWSHETPYCYRLEISLLNAEGQVLEAVSRPVGFRQVEWESGNLLVNGTPVPLRIFRSGGELSDSLSAGYRTTEQLMQDVAEIKKGNYNAVYAENYALSPDWYRLANAHGIYVLEPEGGQGTESGPARLTFPGATPPAAAGAIVDIQLHDFMKGTLSLTNNFAFRQLSAYYLEWEILRNGRKTEQGRVPTLNLAPGAETTLSLGYKTRFHQGNDYFLNLRLKTKTADSLVPANFTVSSRQFRLGPYQYQEEDYRIDKGLIEVSNGPHSIVLNGYDFRIIFDKRSGQINRYSYKGKELLNAGPTLSFRELPAAQQPVPPDSLEKSYALWDGAAGGANVIDYQITEDVNGNYYISFTSSLLAGDARLFQKYRVDGRGAILVENVFVKMQGEYPAMPGFGTGFRLPDDYSEMEWYGREPGAENHVGIYKGAIDAYDTGDKQDVRWLRLRRSDGYGLMVRRENNTLFHFSAKREAAGNEALLLTIDLAREPLPFESMNFAYRLIPYISSASSQ